MTAFVLGLLTAISPCPLATNVTAIGFISRDIGSRRRIFQNGLMYTLGRVITYAGLGVAVIPNIREGANMFSIQKSVSHWGELVIGPLLLGSFIPTQIVLDRTGHEVFRHTGLISTEDLSKVFT